LRRFRLFAVQILAVGVLAAAGVVTAGALAGGSGLSNSTTKTGHGDHHNTGTDEGTTAAPETPVAPPPTSTQAPPPPPVDPLVAGQPAAAAAAALKAQAKTDARTRLKTDTLMMAFICGLVPLGPIQTDQDNPIELGDGFKVYPRGLLFVCQLTISLVLYDLAQINDPPDPHFAQVALPSWSPRTSAGLQCAKRASRTTCQRLSAALLRYQNALAASESAANGLTTSINRFSAASQAGSQEGRRLQTAAIEVYSGELAAAVPAQQSAGRALASAMGAARINLRLDSRTRQRIVTTLSTPGRLPRSLVSALVARGATTDATALSQSLAGALVQLPKTGSLTSALGGAMPTAGLTALHRSLSVYQVALLVRALSSQGAVTAAASDVLLTDLRQSLTAAGATLRTAALAHFVQDTATVPGPAGLLLKSAGQALG